MESLGAMIEQRNKGEIGERESWILRMILLWQEKDNTEDVEGNYIKGVRICY